MPLIFFFNAIYDPYKSHNWSKIVYIWNKSLLLTKAAVIVILRNINTVFYVNTFSNLIDHLWVSICDKSWIFSIITPDFGVTWSFRNHSYLQICCSLMIICGQSLIMVLINIELFLPLHIFVEITMHLIFQNSLFNRRLKIAFISGINTLLVASWYMWCCYKYKNSIFIIVCLFCEFLCLCCYTHLFWFLNESLSFTQTGCASLNWCDCYGQSIIHHNLSSFTTNVIKPFTVILTEIAQLHYTISLWLYEIYIFCS